MLMHALHLSPVTSSPPLSSISTRSNTTALFSFANTLADFTFKNPVLAVVGLSCLCLTLALYYGRKFLKEDTIKPVLPSPKIESVIKPSVQQKLQALSEYRYTKRFSELRYVERCEPVGNEDDIQAEIQTFFDSEKTYIQEGKYDQEYDGERCRYFDEFRRDLFGKSDDYPFVCNTLGKENIFFEATKSKSIVSRKQICEAWLLTKKDALIKVSDGLHSFILPAEIDSFFTELNKQSTPLLFQRFIDTRLDHFLKLEVNSIQKIELKHHAKQTYKDILISFLDHLSSGTKRSAGYRGVQCGSHYLSGAKFAVYSVKHALTPAHDLNFESWLNEAIVLKKEQLLTAYFMDKHQSTESRRLIERFFGFLSQLDLGVRNKYGHHIGMYDGNGFDLDGILTFFKRETAVKKMVSFLSKELTRIAQTAMDSDYQKDDKPECKVICEGLMQFVRSHSEWFENEVVGFKSVFGANVVDTFELDQIHVSEDAVLFLLEKLGWVEPQSTVLFTPKSVLTQLRDGGMNFSEFVTTFPNLSDVLPWCTWSELVRDLEPKVDTVNPDFSMAVTALLKTNQLAFSDLIIDEQTLPKYLEILKPFLLDSSFRDQVVEKIKKILLGPDIDVNQASVILHFFSDGDAAFKELSFHLFQDIRENYYKRDAMFLSVAFSCAEMMFSSDKHIIRRQLSKEMIMIAQSDYFPLMVDMSKPLLLRERFESRKDQVHAYFNRLLNALIPLADGDIKGRVQHVLFSKKEAVRDVITTNLADSLACFYPRLEFEQKRTFLHIYRAKFDLLVINARTLPLGARTQQASKDIVKIMKLYLSSKQEYDLLRPILFSHQDVNNVNKKSIFYIVEPFIDTFNVEEKQLFMRTFESVSMLNSFSVQAKGQLLSIIRHELGKDYSYISENKSYYDQLFHILGLVCDGSGKADALGVLFGDSLERQKAILVLFRSAFESVEQLPDFIQTIIPDLVRSLEKTTLAYRLLHSKNIWSRISVSNIDTILTEATSSVSLEDKFQIQCLLLYLKGRGQTKFYEVLKYQLIRHGIFTPIP